MGFQGQLSSVQLADLFQTIAMNRQTGTFVVSTTPEPTHVFFDQGQVAAATAPRVGGLPFLLNAAIRRNLLASEMAQTMAGRLRTSGQPVREQLINQGIQEALVEDLCLWCLEEIICPLFELPDASFTFQDGDPTPEVQGVDAIGVYTVRMATPQLVMEGTRRKDEWQRIRALIPDPASLPVVDNDTRSNLRGIEIDAEMQKVMRFFDGRRTLDEIADLCGMSRFDVHVIAAQLIQAGAARLRDAQEVVDDALALRQAGDVNGAKDLLEHVLTQHRLPEVMRPLAEISAETKQSARAVELYLELIQRSQDAGELATALADLDTVIGLSPEDPELHFERAQVRADLGKAEDAAAGFVTAAQAFLAVRDSQRALDACHRARNLLPRSPDPHRYLAKAYLLEGEADSAVVEYKSLWHALLSANRPGKALDELRKILDLDCKFPAVKDQVLSHAMASEPVKSARSLRFAINVFTGLVVIAALIGGWRYYQTVVVLTRGQGEVAALSARLTTGQEQLEHPVLIEEASRLKAKYSGFEDLHTRLSEIETSLHQDYETRAKGVLDRGQALLEGGDWAGAARTLGELKAGYGGTAAAAQADAMTEKLRQRRVETEVGKDLAEADRLWRDLDWDAAIVRIERILERKDLPSSLRDRLVKQNVEAKAKINDSTALLDRAKRIAGKGDLAGALAAYRRAANAPGDSAAAAATAAIACELAYARSIGTQVRERGEKGDADGAFAHLDSLVALAGEAANPDVRTYLDKLEIPYALTVDSPRTQVLVRRNGTDQPVKAPTTGTGPWILRLTVRRGETVQVLANRTGFAPTTINLTAASRQVAGNLVLERGPRWRADLAGGAATGTVLAGNQLLVGTSRSTVDTIEPDRGTVHQIPLPDLVAEFRYPPFKVGDRAFMALDETIHGVDLKTRTRAGAWELGVRLTGPLWIQEHDLIQGMLVAIVGVQRGGAQLFAFDAQGKVVRYPAPALESDLTGEPVVSRSNGHSLAWLPAGNEIAVFDITSVTETSAPLKIFSVNTRGDTVGRPVRTRLGTRNAMLVVDAGGQVVALDAEIDTPIERRIIGAWPLSASQPTTPVISDRTAYVAGGDGHVTALDLERPGKTRWRSPTDGSFGPAAGEPAVGQRAVYLATTTGLLVSLDLATGKERWRVDLGSPAAGAPTARDGRIYLALKGGQVWCIEEGDE